MVEIAAIPIAEFLVMEDETSDVVCVDHCAGVVGNSEYLLCNKIPVVYPCAVFECAVLFGLCILEDGGGLAVETEMLRS